MFRVHATIDIRHSSNDNGTQQTDFKWVSMLNAYALLCVYLLFSFICTICWTKNVYCVHWNENKLDFCSHSLSRFFIHTHTLSYYQCCRHWNMRFKHTNCIYSIRPICVILKQYNNNILNGYTLRGVHKSWKSIHDSLNIVMHLRWLLIP